MNIRGVIAIAVGGLLLAQARADTTIDPATPHGYGANIGWINAAVDETNGAVIGQAFCMGWMWGANIGWICLGDGSPSNGVAYQNNSASDYGVNHDGQGNLSGYAYGANIGWILFEPSYGQPRVDLENGNLSGYAYGANVGWINLSTLATLTLAAPDSDSDGIADAWEYGHTNTLAVLTGGGADHDGDGVVDVDEFIADTDPFDGGDYLSITALGVDGCTNRITWPGKATRCYELQHATLLSNSTEWTMTRSPFVPAAETDVTETVPDVADPIRFYRVKADVPLHQGP